MTLKCSGLSLVELLIGLLISSVIFLSLMQVYLSGKRQYQAIQKQLTVAFEVEKIALWMRDSIARAGFTPCLGIENLVVDDRRNSHNRPKALVIEDKVLHINRMSHYFERVLSVQSPTKLLVTSNSPIKLNHPLLLADCTHAEIHMPQNVIKTSQGQQIILKRPMIHSFNEKTYAGKWIEEKWSVPTEDKGLYYHALKHKEAISSYVLGLLAKREASLVTVILMLKNKKEHKLVVRVRGL